MNRLFAIAALVGACHRGDPPAQVASAASPPPAAARPPAAAPTSCDPDGIHEIDRATAGPGDPSYVSYEVASGIAHACPMPAAIHEALVAEEGSRETAAAKGVLNDQATWQRACRGGGDVLASAAHGDADLATATWAGCDVATLGIADESEWQRARHVVATLLARRVLVDDGIGMDRVRAYVRAVAELPPGRVD